jgi:hypothetical protein
MNVVRITENVLKIKLNGRCPRGRPITKWKKPVRNGFTKNEQKVKRKYGGALGIQGQIEETELRYPYEIKSCRKACCKKLHFMHKN